MHYLVYLSYFKLYETIDRRISVLLNTWEWCLGKWPKAIGLQIHRWFFVIFLWNFSAEESFITFTLKMKSTSSKCRTFESCRPIMMIGLTVFDNPCRQRRNFFDDSCCWWRHMNFFDCFHGKIFGVRRSRETSIVTFSSPAKKKRKK